MNSYIFVKVFTSKLRHSRLFAIKINKTIELFNVEKRLIVAPSILIRGILQKNRDCKEDYRLHEACSREDDDDHDEKRVVAGQACPMALRGILLQHLHFSSQEKS